MLPELIKVGPFVLRSYGVLMAAGFGFGTWWFIRRGRARSIEPARILDLAIIVLVAGLVGARLLYVATHWYEFSEELWRIFWPVQPGGVVGIHGLVFYGGVLTAVPVAAMVVRRWQLSPLNVLDAAAPSLALGSAIGRMGCFLNGCCFGVPTDGPLGIIFPPGSMAGTTYPGIPLHPVQLYMVADNLLIVAFLLWIERRWARFDGVVIGAYFVLTGLMRGYEDLLRYYEGSMQLLAVDGVVVTVNHMIGIVMAAGGVLLIVRSRSRRSD